jgi:uncharacterized protein YecT (DUF1311 family)
MLLIMASALSVGAASADPRCASTQTNDLLACAYNEYQNADEELNAHWDKMPHGEALVQAQRAWIAWRDLECVAENAAIGGREEQIWHYACLAELTAERTRQLKDQYRWMALNDEPESDK